MKKSALFAAICVPAFLAAAPLAAKTLVYCSEGSPENFFAGINTTGTTFDVTGQIYSRVVDFERGGTQVIPGLAEKWTVSPDGLVYTFNLRKGVKCTRTRTSSRPATPTPTTSSSPSSASGSRSTPSSR